MTEPVRLNLSWPPSTNNLFVNVPKRGRVPSKEYGRWRNDAGWELKAQRPPKIDYPVHIELELCAPKGESFDLDNRLKAPLDLLKECGVIIDDSAKYVRSVKATVVHGAAPCTIIIERAA